MAHPAVRAFYDSLPQERTPAPCGCGRIIPLEIVSLMRQDLGMRDDGFICVQKPLGSFTNDGFPYGRLKLKKAVTATPPP